MANGWFFANVRTLQSSPPYGVCLRTSDNLLKNLSNSHVFLILCVLKICSTKVCKCQGKSAATAILVTSIVIKYGNIRFGCYCLWGVVGDVTSNNTYNNYNAKLPIMLTITTIPSYTMCLQYLATIPIIPIQTSLIFKVTKIAAVLLVIQLFHDLCT